MDNGTVQTFWQGVIQASDFTDLIAGMKELVVILIPAVILPLCLLKKGVSFLKGLLYTA